MSWNQIPEHERLELTQRLTTKQHNVLVLWLAGCSYDRIAEYLGISPRTVRTHLKRAKQIHADITRQEAA